TQQDGPLNMGMHQFNKYQYANKDFFLNCLEYLTNPTGILEARSKDYTLRLLDNTKVENNRGYWQFFNIGVPVVFVALCGLLFAWIRKRKYSSPDKSKLLLSSYDQFREPHGGELIFVDLKWINEPGADHL